MKTIYILLTKTDTALSRAIKVVTREPFTHSSISLDSSLTKLYTFSRRQAHRPLPAGFVIENPNTGYMGLHPETACEVYELSIPDASYTYIKNKIEHMSKRADSLHYSILGTVYCMFHIRHKRPDHYFCSQFIGELLRESGALNLPKHESLMHPVDYCEIPETRLLYHGNIHGLVTYYIDILNGAKNEGSPQKDSVMENSTISLQQYA